MTRMNRVARGKASAARVRKIATKRRIWRRKTTENGNFSHSYCRLNNDTQTKFTHPVKHSQVEIDKKRGENERMDEYEYAVRTHIVLCVRATKSVSSSGTVEELWQHATYKKRFVIYRRHTHTHTQLESTHTWIQTQGNISMEVCVLTREGNADSTIKGSFAASYQYLCEGIFQRRRRRWRRKKNIT